MADWVQIILPPRKSLGISSKELHLFQIFATMTCDPLWFSRNRAHHDGLTFGAILISIQVKKITLEHGAT